MRLDLLSDAMRALPFDHLCFLLLYPASIDLPEIAATALPVGHLCFLSLSGEAYQSNAVSLGLLSDAVRALPVEHLCFLLLCPASIDFPVDTTRALPVKLPCFLFSLSGRAYSSDAVSLDLQSNTARASSASRPYSPSACQ